MLGSRKEYLALDSQSRTKHLHIKGNIIGGVKITAASRWTIGAIVVRKQSEGENETSGTVKRTSPSRR